MALTPTSPEWLPVLRAAHAGDATALEQVLRVCQRDLRRYAYRHCLFNDVDDAVQEALLVLARKLHSVRALAALSGWLLQVVRRECHRLSRRTLRFDPWDDDSADAWLGTQSDASLPFEVARAVQSLPAHYRDVLLLRDVEELGIAEIAASLQLSPAAVKSRLHRARAMAREYLLA